jgi:hypothetical protein
VAVLHCLLIHLYGSQAYKLVITTKIFVDDPYKSLSLLGYLPRTRLQDALSYVDQKLILKGVNEDTAGIPIRRRPLGNSGKIDLQLWTATHFSELADGEAAAYGICPTSNQLPDEE